MLQDNMLKTVCDVVIIVVCACELAYQYQLAVDDGVAKGRYAAIFAMTMACVLASCALALGVKVCRMMVHAGSTHRMPHAVLAYMDGTPDLGARGGSNAAPEHLQEEQRAMAKFCAIGVVSEAEERVLRKYFIDVAAELKARAEQQRGGRVGTNLEYSGNLLPKQKFFVVSFPGIYANVWKRMTEGAHTLVLACACVFFQDTMGGVNGKHVKDKLGCRCDFCAAYAPDQERS